MRNVEVRVKLAPSIAEALARIGERRGLLPATLAAAALGEWIERQEQTAQLQRLSVLDAGKRFADSLTDERLEKVFSGVLTADVLREIAATAATEGLAGQGVSSAGPQAAAGECAASPDRARTAT